MKKFKYLLNLFLTIGLYNSGVNAADITITSGNTEIISSLVANNYFLENNATLNLNTNASVDGTIDGNAASQGLVNVNNNYTTLASIGSTNSINTLNITDNSTLTADHNITATNVNVGEGNSGVLDLNAILTATTLLNDNATLNLNTNASVDGTIDGNAASQGLVNVNNNYTTLASIGSTNSINTLNITDNSTLTADHNITATNVNVGEGSFLNINSDINSNINNDGTITFGNAGYNINGNIIGASGSDTIFDLGSETHNINGVITTGFNNLLKVSVDDLNTNSYGKLVVSGTSNVDDSIKLNFLIGNNSTDLTHGDFNLIEGGVGNETTDINRSNININGVNTINSGKYIISVGKFNDNLTLRVTDTSKVADYTSDSNDKSTYLAILNNSSAGGNLQRIQESLISFSKNNEQKLAIVQSLAPQDNNALQIGTFTSVNNSINTTTERLMALRNNDIHQGVAAGDKNIDKGIWGQIFGSNTKQDKAKSDDGFKSNSAGFAFGADQELYEDTTFGLSFSYANTDIKTTSGSDKRTDVDSYQFNLYNGNNFGQYFVDTSFGVALNEYSSSRIISSINSVSKAKFSGITYIAKAEGGVVKKLGNSNFDIVPKLTLTLARSNVDSYTEEGAGNASLNVSSTRANFAEGKLGFDLGYDGKIKDIKIRPEINLAYGYDFVGARPEATSNFVGQTASFTTRNTNVDKSSYRVGTSMGVYNSDQLKFMLNYTYEYRESRVSNTGSLQARYNF
jgi:outer membrane autotransporter protein